MGAALEPDDDWPTPGAMEFDEISVLSRHFPALVPHLFGLDNAFGIWKRKARRIVRATAGRGTVRIGG